jgi:hypothetical protein
MLRDCPFRGKYSGGERAESTEFASSPTAAAPHVRIRRSGRGLLLLAVARSPDNPAAADFATPTVGRFEFKSVTVTDLNYD